MLGIESWRRWWGWERQGPVTSLPVCPTRVQSAFSATLFWGDIAAWDRYLGTPRTSRYDGPLQARIRWQAATKQLVLEPENEASSPLVQQLNLGWTHLRERLAATPFVLAVLDELLFGTTANAVDQLWLRSSSLLPSEATRESHVGDRGTVFVVFQAAWVEDLERRLAAAGPQVTPLQQLGYVWPLLRRLLSQLGYPAVPRDRFLEKIDLTSRLLLIAAHVLYDYSSRENLQPNAAGLIYQHYLSQRSGMSCEKLAVEHPYFRLLHELATILFDETAYREQEWLVKVFVREYLDDRYLRLSVSGIMPWVSEAMLPMPYRWRTPRQRVDTPLPRIGRYGILDDEDLHAWRVVERPFRDMGFVLVSQLGMGEFGRVYAALNLHQPQLPSRIALKVDRITSNVTKSIQDAQMAMAIGRDLARSPHIIRLYDAGQLKRHQLTYHVLQLVDGDTLDNLVGVTGHEHSSIHPRQRTWTEDELQREYEQSVRLSVAEQWRRQRLREPFTQPLTLSQAMDLQTSIFLWVEKVHAMGYAVNDLKNGNLMVSHRGQLKGIDLDAYRRTEAAIDRMSDFLFLSTSLLLYLLHATGRKEATALTAERMLKSRDSLREGIEESWGFEDVSRVSHGRVENADVIDLLVDLITRCRSRTYIDAPHRFSNDIDRWIRLKRAIFIEELVLD